MIALENLEGRWYINMTNFPMWLKGDKLNPTFNYKKETKKGVLGLADEVQYTTKKGAVKSILGFDTALNEEHTSFLWRGKGWLFFVTSKWSIEHFDAEKKWAIIRFEKTLFTPKGYDVISRAKQLDEATLQAVQEQLDRLNITAQLTII